MRTLLTGAAIGALVLTASAQNPRPSTNLHGCSEITFDPQIATEGEISVCAVSTGDSGAGAAHIEVWRSDGQGISWTGPVQVDGDATGARKDLDHPSYLQVVGGTVYMIWKDDRGADTDVYFSCSTDGGATWAAETLLDTALHGDTFGARMAVSGSHVYVAYEANEPGGSDDQLLIVASHDGGATFGPAVNPSVGGGPGTLVDVDNLDMRADGLTVHVAWSDDRVGGQNNLFYQQSTDGGATWLGTDVQIDPGGVHDVTSGVVSMALDGSLLAISWDAETSGSGNESFYVNTSTDSGATFGGAVLVGGYTDGTHDVDNSTLMVSGGNIIACWEDDRNGGSDEIFSATSTDSGATWTESGPHGIGGFPRVSNVSSVDEDGCALCWTGPAFPEDNLHVVSTDNGVTFGTAFAANDTANDADFAEMRWNALYNNYMTAWQSDECDDGLGGFFNNTYVGGYRPQTITANGWTGGPAMINFDFDRFDVATCSDAWAIVNLSGPGFLPLPDGRNLGLTPDPLINASIQLGLVGLASATVAPTGSGSTPVVSVPLPPGFTFYAVGVGIDPGTATLCDVTDVIVIGT